MTTRTDPQTMSSVELTSNARPAAPTTELATDVDETGTSKPGTLLLAGRIGVGVGVGVVTGVDGTV